MPPTRKPDSKRQNRVTKDFGVLTPVAGRAIPPAPAGLLKKTKEQWAAFWTTDLATVVNEANMPALVRYFELLDERERCMTSARKGRLVPGSTGQPVLNPLYKHVQTLEAQITSLEDRFGLTPMAALKLGIKFGEAQRTLADLNAEAEESVDDDFDPRIQIIEGSALA